MGATADSTHWTPFRRLKQRLRRRGLEAMFRGAATLTRLSPRASFARNGVERIRDVAYRPGGVRRHRLDVYRPRDPGAGPRPALIYVHGGGFSILSKETHWVMALRFARQGYVVFNVDYRLAPEHPFPSAVEDVCEAYAWVARHGAKFGADVQRLALAGESAGGNLVSVLAIAACYERPEPFARRVFETGVTPSACLPFYGFHQASDPGRFKRNKPHLRPWISDQITAISRSYLGRSRAENAALADPVVVLEEGAAPARPLPAFHLPVGTKDPILDDSRRMAGALDRLGVPNELRVYPGELHGFHAMIWRENAKRCWREAFAFLDRHVPAERPQRATAPALFAGALAAEHAPAVA